MINYLCTSPLPNVEGTDAVYNEINILHQNFKGSIESLYPFKTPSSRYPVVLLGAHKIWKLKSIEKESKINHIYGAGLFNMAAINSLKKPTVYSLITGIASLKNLPSKTYINKFDAIIVSNERDYGILKQYGVDKISLIRTSVEVDDFEKQSLPLDKTLHLMMVSSPWECKQFKSKGIHIVLSALQHLDDVHITFLWRDILVDEMRRLIKFYRVEDKVTVVNRRVDVNTYLSKTHGTFLFVNDSRVIKAYPHSLLESLCAGKPVMLTQNIPLTDFVKNEKAGLVLESFSNESVMKTLSKFRVQYAELSTNAFNISKEAFSKERFIEEHKKLYDSVVNNRVI